MRKLFVMLLFIVLINNISNAQVTGIVNIPDEATLTSTITDLNTNGVGVGGATLNFTTSFNLTSVKRIGSTILNASLSVSNPLILSGNGNTLNAQYGGTNTGSITTGANDAMFVFEGTDFVTIQNLGFTEQASNNTTTLAIENALAFYNRVATSPFDGCQNITITGCTFGLGKSATNGSAIYSTSYIYTGTASLAWASFATDPSQMHRIITINNNTFNGSYNHVVFRGASSGANGRQLIVTNNTFNNIGGGASASYGTYALYLDSLIFNNNTGSTSISQTSTNYIAFASTNCGGYQEANNNNITLQSGVTTSATNGITYTSIGGNRSMNGNTINIGSFPNITSGIINAIAATYSGGNNNLSHQMNSNIFQNQTLPGTTGTITILSNTSSATGTGRYTYTNNNTINNINKSNSGILRPIDVGTADTAYIENNTVSNINVTNNSTSSTSTLQALFASTGAEGLFIKNNTINNLNISGSTTSSSNALTAILSLTASSGIVDISGNTIRNLSFDNSSTGSVTILGITQSTSTNASIYKNKIYELDANSGASSLVRGIQTTAGISINVFNNLIGNLTAGVSASVDAIRGINITSTTASSAQNISFNSIYLNTSSSGANFGTAGIFHTFNTTSTTATLNMRNNIVVNNSVSAGTGLTVAFRRSAATDLNNYSTNSNNNLFYAGIPSSTNLIYHDGTNSDQTLASFKARVAPRESSSITENPNFLSTTGSAADFLHINPAVATQIESNGVPVAGITDDYDGDTRNVTTPDIGADEFAGIGADLNPPTISYTPFNFTCLTGNRTLTASISDASGVPTSGAGLPVLYWRINAGAWNAVTATYISGSNYEFTFGNGVVAGDVVQYYIVAQDNASTPNIGSFPATGASGFSANPPAASTAPTTPSSYNITTTINGTYSVGTGGAYSTLTAAINAYNTSCLTGPVVFELTDASYGASETFPIVVLNNPDASSVNTLTVRPASGNAVTISGTSGTSASALIRLNGARYITFDGINSGGASMLLENTSVTTGTAVFWLSSNGAGQGATNNTIQKTSIRAGIDQTTSTSVTYGVVIAGNTLSATLTSVTAGDDNDNNIIQENNFTRVRYGVYTRGGSPTNPNIGTIITRNVFGPTSFGSNQIGKSGVVSREEDGIQITQNTFQYIGGAFENISTGSDRVAIALTTDGTWSNSSTTPPTAVMVRNAIITRNTINNVIEERTFSAAGIVLSTVDGTNPTNNLVANNMISNVKSNGTISDQTLGIGIGTGNGDKIVFNSIHLSGDTDPNASATTPTQTSTGINITTTSVTNPLVRNNIVLMNLTSSSATTLRGACMGIPASYSWGTGGSNFNNFYAPPTNTVAQTGVVGGTSGTFYPSLSNWQTATSQDANSTAVQPIFVSSNDLHLVPASNGGLINTGTPIAGVTNDFDNDTRDATNPDMGADEFTAPVVIDAGITAIVNANPLCPGSNLVSATVTNFGTVTINSVLINWSVTPGGTQTQVNPGAISIAPGASQTFALGNFTFAAGTLYSIQAFTSNPNGGADASNSNDTLTQNNIQTGMTGTYTVGAGGNYTTLTAAVADYNSRSICGPIVFSLTDANYTTPAETIPIVINANASANATNTLTIRPAPGNNVVISGAVGTGAIIKLNGADYVTIDGSNNGSNSRNLTIQNTTTTTTGNAVVWMASPAVGNGATNNIIRNTIIEGNSTTTSFIGLFVGGNATVSLTAAGAERNNNNTITNNLFRKTQHGLVMFGFAAATPDQNNLVNNNNIGTAITGEGFALSGMTIDRQENLIVSGNEVQNITNTSTASNVFGIRLLDFKNGQAFNNKVHTMSYTGTSTAKFYGIAVSSSTYTTVGNPSNALLYNNMISNITSTGTSAVWNTTGILAGVGYGDRYYHNSVHLSGQLANSTSGLAAAFAMGDGNITGTPTNIDVQNNILSISGSNGAAGGNFWSIYTPATTLTGSIINYNNYYCNATNVTNNIGRFNAINHTTLASWQSATGQDASTVNIAPVFVANNNPHLEIGSNSTLDNLGTPLAAVTSDIDNDTRSVTTPDMGADEFTTINCAAAVGGVATGTAFGCLSYGGALSATGYSTGVGSTYQWVSATNPAGPWTAISGANNPASYTISPAITVTTYFKLAVACATNTSVDSSTMVTITIAAKPLVPITPAGPVTICAPNAQVFNASGTNASAPSFIWLRNNTVISGATSATYSATQSGNYRVRVVDGVTGCFDTSAIAVLNVNPQPTSPISNATPSVVCTGSNVNLTSSASIGYSMNSAGTESFIDIDANPTVTNVVTLSDDSEHNINMPQFIFNGITYTTARVGMNGVIVLGSTTGDVTTTNAALPSTTNTAGNIFLAPWWDDLDILSSPQTTIKLDTVGSKFIIQWTNTANNFTLPSTDVVKFQVQLDTANGQIHFVYNDVSFGNPTYDAGLTATVGIQWNSTTALQYSFNTASLTAGQCITFSPTLPAFSWTGPNGFASTLQNPVLTNVSSLDSGTYTVTFTNPVTGCFSTATTNVNVVPAGVIAWTGAVNTDWNNAGNWTCGSIPTITSEVIIYGGMPRYPIVNLNVEIKKLSLMPGASVTVGTGFDLKLNGN